MIGRYKILVHKHYPETFGQWDDGSISIRHTPDPMTPGISMDIIRDDLPDRAKDALDHFDLITVEIKKV